ncbi:TetR/AcrR family transcriptional regulator [Paenibacillus flagellatus]|uniref:TetR/AcrR family transcriptional regulator n=1 Tax=Paenibacillus flagellatus TaxID=2211139 RepID=A0A2V5L0N2_9BACL|nr:TetR/AcrR family transcriptional regulator [Paenibacillus flagellatus]PYI56126.1 TetR/AcrR family transcriptional regulator [Paenibacillus flagellatus]
MSDAKAATDRRIKRTRQAIRDALIELIDENGFDSITVQEIAERADINRSTFYFHYKDKFDLLNQSSDEMLQELSEALKAGGRNPDGACRLLGSSSVASHFEHIADNAAFYRVMLGRQGVPCFAKQMRGAIREAFYGRLGSFRPDEDERSLNVPADLLCGYVASAHFGMIEWWLENGMTYSPAYMATMLDQLVKHGPLNAAGILER